METLETMATEATEVATEAVEAMTEVVEVVTEATEPLMEQLAPLYDALVLNCNLTLVLICATGIVAGLLLGSALWRWLK